LPGTLIVNDGIAMAKAIDALRPWRDDLVLVGGWAHRLHRLHPGATRPSYAAIATRDADVAFDTAARLQGDIAAALDKAGFDKILKSEHVPPVSHFQFGEEEAGFFVEFLTPLRGRGTLRDGSDDATVSTAGVTAQKLRHLDVLLTAPWKIDLVPSGQLPLAESTYLNVANPVSFIVQKLLIHHLRLGQKKAQDLLYMHDTLQLFASSLPALNALWREQVARSLTQKELKEAKGRAHLIFERTTDTIREAVRIPVDRRIDPEEFRMRCELGLEQLLALDT
jgi:hypothetical protein